MSFLRILKNKSSLEGTAYVELLPGKYKEQCWNTGSLFLDEETFGFFEKIVEHKLPDYDHYAFTEASGTLSGLPRIRLTEPCAIAIPKPLTLAGSAWPTTRARGGATHSQTSLRP